MAGRPEPQDTGDHEMVDWEVGAEEMDEDFRQGNTVELPSDSDDDLKSELDEDLNHDADQEIGTIDEKDLYSDDEVFGGVDDSLASVQHTASVLGVAVAQVDSQCLLATGGQDDVAVLWTIEDSWGGSVKVKQRSRLEGHTDSVIQVAFSHDGKYLATAGYDGLVKIWAPDTGALVQSLEGPAKEVEWILWHPKGHAILAGSTDTMAWMWWAPTGKLMQIFAGHAQSVSCGAWGLAGKLIVTASEDKSVIVWNPRQGTPQHHVKQVHDSAIVSMCSHPEAPIVVTGSEDATAKVIQIETGKVLSTLSGHTDSVEAVAFNNAAAGGMSLLATGSMDGKVMIWDGKTFDLRCTLKDHFERGGVTKVKWLPSSYPNILASCATDSTCRIFDALGGSCLHCCYGHKDTVLDIDMSLVGQGKVCIVSGSDDNHCKVFVVPLDGTGNKGNPPEQAQAQQGPFNPPDRTPSADVPV